MSRETSMAVAQLLRRYGIEAARVRTLSPLGQAVHRITPTRLAHGAAAHAGGELSLRIYPAAEQGLADIQAEIDWLLMLSAAGLHVPRPLVDREGRWLQAWLADPAGPRHAVLLTWVGGRMHDKGLSPQRLRRVGVLTAHLHNSAQALVEAGRIGSTRQAQFWDLRAWAEGRRPPSAHVSPALHTLVQPTAARLIHEIAALPRDARHFGFVHGDLHPWNLVFTRHVAGAFDFSECGWGHHALDLASTLQYLKHPLANNHDHRQQYGRFVGELLEGYAGVRSLPADVQRQIDLYIVARCFGTLEWMLDDWPAPGHRAWGPGFLAGLPKIFEDFLG
jgi:Ser/Thr protein kinase RdoA (MazF antagonist)